MYTSMHVRMMWDGQTERMNAQSLSIYKGDIVRIRIKATQGLI